MVEENRIFVGALSQNTSEQSLLEYFQQYGAVECTIHMDKQTGRSKGFGFVSFQDGGMQSGDLIQEVLSIKHTVDGKTVDCKVSVQKGLAPPPQNPLNVPAASSRSGNPANGGFDPSAWQQPMAHGRGGTMRGSPQLPDGRAPASGEAPTQHKLFVGGLSQRTTKESMHEYFSTYGLCDCVIMVDKETGRSRGFGFVVYELQDAVLSALSMQGHELDGKQVECKACEEPNAPTAQPSSASWSAGQHDVQHHGGAPVHAAQQNRHYEHHGGAPVDATRMFVGGLPQTCDSNRLGAYFSQFGPVTEAKVHMDKDTQRSKGFGYVSFDSPHSVELALANGRNLVIDDKWVEVKRSEARSNKGAGSGGSGWHPASGDAFGGLLPPRSFPDLGIPLAPGSQASKAAQYLAPEQAFEIRRMVHLLQDPTTCSVIQALIDDLNPAVAVQLAYQPLLSKGGGGGRRHSPY